MASPLDRIAATVNAATKSIFYPATLTRGGTPHACRAIFSEWGKAPGPSGALTPKDATILIPVASLDVEPDAGDVVTLQGQDFVVFTGSNSALAVTTDPARAMWTLLAKRAPIAIAGQSSSAALAAVIGAAFTIYRPGVDDEDAFSGTSQGSTKALFAAASGSAFNLRAAAQDAKTLYYALIDESLIQPGDILDDGAGATYFIGDMRAPLPTVAMRATARVEWRRLRSPDAGEPSIQVGDIGYSGHIDTTDPAVANSETVLKTNAPATIYVMGIGRNGSGALLPDNLAGLTRWSILLPISIAPKGALRDRDIIVDDAAYRYQVTAASWTQHGYLAQAVRLEA